jgi:hypothetical protein
MPAFVPLKVQPENRNKSEKIAGDNWKRITSDRALWARAVTTFNIDD